MPRRNKLNKNAVEKVVVDKTFGLKNKNKSKKVQRYVQDVERQAKFKGMDLKAVKRQEAERKAREEAKKRRAKEEKELNAIFKPALSAGGGGKIKAPALKPGQTPKDVLCAFFQAGKCRKGGKCKFSHDMSLARKSEKMNLYEDNRETDTMDKWDQAKLEDVIKKKHVVRPNQTEIVCKYFLDAIENKKYGWFWKCPNGNTCIYRHRLPLGFVFKPKTEVKEEEDSGPCLEEVIEEERAKLVASSLTPVTPETFAAWKERRKQKRDADSKRRAEEVANNKRKHTGKNQALSGRDLFQFDPTLFVDDAEAEEEYEIDEWDGEDEDAKAEADIAAGDSAAAGPAAGDAGGNVSASVTETEKATEVHDPSLFLDDDVELPDDEEDDGDDE